MHSNWGIGGSEVIRGKITAKAKKGLSHLYKPASLNTLHDIAMKFKQVAGEVGLWRILREKEGKIDGKLIETKRLFDKTSWSSCPISIKNSWNQRRHTFDKPCLANSSGNKRYF